MMKAGLVGPMVCPAILKAAIRILCDSAVSIDVVSRAAELAVLFWSYCSSHNCGVPVAGSRPPLTQTVAGVLGILLRHASDGHQQAQAKPRSSIGITTGLNNPQRPEPHGLAGLAKLALFLFDDRQTPALSVHEILDGRN